VTTLAGLFERDSTDTAILAPGRPPLSYRELACRVWGIAAALRAAGVRRTGRVAVVLPNGPEMATAFLGVACSAVCAPLNPAYQRSEFLFYFEDLHPELLVLQQGMDSPARAAAAERGIAVLEIAPESPLVAPAANELPEPGDVALVLHTSGTTSRPKIVPLTHRNLCASARNIGRTLELTARDRCLNVMPLFHIHGLVAALLSSLAAGGSVVCAPGFLAPEFFPWIDEFAPTWYTAVPTIHQAVLARAGEHRETLARRRLRFLRSSSAPLPPTVMLELEAAFGAPLIEAYGMTEAAHQMASNRLPPGIRKPGSVGLAAGPEIAILSESHVLHPAGDGPIPAGEVVIRGDNVTAGYESNPEANRQAFHEGWFRTGDIGSLDADGYLTLTGRTKEMINRGGEKIAPREVDEALLRHPSVAQALAFALPDVRLGEDVAAAVVLKPGHEITEAALRDFAAQTIAQFKVPRRIVFLDEIPKGPTGKPQRIGLAERLGIEAGAARNARPPYVAPNTPTGVLVARIWEDVLRIREAGETDDFFACGGDSLLAAVVIARLSERLNKRLTILSLFSNPVLGRFAAYCDSAAPLAAWPPVTIADRTGDLPASYAQERMWFLLQYEPDSQPYTSTLGLRLDGELNVEALARSLAAVVERHEILRTVYDLHGARVVQRILDAPPLPWRVEEMPGAGLDDICQLALVERSRHFDLSKDLPFRAVLVRTSATESYLVLATQHVATDGWSKSVMVADLAAYYRHFAASEPLQLEPLPFQYADYAAWERSFLVREVFPAQIEYWKRALAGAPPSLEIPADHPRPRHQTFHGGFIDDTIPATLLGEFHDLCRSRQATLYMGLLAVLDVVLSRYSGVTDIVVGSPIANRDLAGTEPMIGIFMNTVALRTDLSGDPCFRDLLDRVRETALSAYENRQAAFAAVVEALDPVRSSAYSPIYQVLFQVRNFPRRSAEAAGVSFEEVDLLRRAVSFDIELEATESAENLHLRLIFNRDLFERATAERMLRHFRNALQEACQDPSRPVAELMLADAAERTLVVEYSQGPRQAPPSMSLPQMVEAKAAAVPDRVAVHAGERRRTYAEFNAEANRIANGLLARGVGRGDIVGVALGRSVELPAALLGVLKAGAAYLPLDAQLPAERSEYMIRDSRMRLLLGAGAQGGLPLGEVKSSNGGNPGLDLLPDDVAYVLYTSGSTGVPKGVAIPHGALANLLSAVMCTTGFGADDCWLATTTTSFDISIPELFVPLIAGGSVHLAPEGIAADGEALAKYLKESECTFLQATPTGWRILLSAGWAGSPRLRGISAGEELPLETAKEIRRRVGRLWNLYGPTETTIYSTGIEIPEEPRAVTIGRPIANTQVYVLDERLRLQPPGVPGELYIAGAGLACGYLNRPDLTAARFVANPFGGSGRMYRTGDVGRLLADGSIEFRGRADSQIKLRGFRIELEEIESAVARQPSVEAAAAVLHHAEAADPLLVCYVVRRGAAADPEAAELRHWLQRSLPDYMIPARFVELRALPKNVNGKLDRKALAARPLEAVAGGGYRAPANPVEERLAQICGELLDCGPVAANADLFELGAHSLLCATLLARIEREFGCRIPLPKLFECPTVERLAAAIQGEPELLREPRIVAVRQSGTGVPLFWIKADPMFRALADRLPADQPVYGLYLPEDHGLGVPYGIEDAAAFHLETLRGRQPSGPYFLGGFCAAGLVAYEMARRLEALGEHVAALVLIETLNPRAWRGTGVPEWIRRQTSELIEKGPLRYTKEKTRALQDWVARRDFESRLARGGEEGAEALREADNPRFIELRFAARRYDPAHYEGALLLVRRRLTGRERADLGWSELAPRLEILELETSHLGFFIEPHVSRLAEAVSAHIRRAGTSIP
jgi:amino acid adenylation domain-containing protein